MLDWDDLRFFLAIARCGSLTASAKELKVAQSTVGRRLASLEFSLAVRLLQRTPDGYILTLAGRSVHEQAERVEREVLAVERSVGGKDTRLEGLVRVNCTETFAAHVLAPCFAALRDKHPGIVIELVATSTPLSLAMREADLALRLTPPVQNELIVRKIGRVAFGLYAAPSYLERYGVPDFEAGCAGHKLMTLMGDPDSDAQAVWLSELAARATLGLQTGSHEALLCASRSGGGLACLARFRADRDPELRRVSTPRPAPTTDIWLLVHKDSRSTLRFRATMSAITDGVKERAAELDPDRSQD